jgi:hypothetical protein
MSVDKHTKSKKAYLVSLKDKLKKHLQLQSISANQVDRRWLNGFMAAGFHSGLISLSDLKLEYLKAHRSAYGERMTEAQDQQLERRLTKLCQMH